MMEEIPPIDPDPAPWANGEAAGVTFDDTDIRNAELLIERHGRDVRYVATWKKWLAFDGTRWLLDDLGRVLEHAKDTARYIAEMANTKEQKKWAAKSGTIQRLHAMVAVAASDPSIAITHHRLDADPWLLNVSNGTVDLRTGKLRPHRRDDLCTKLAPVVFELGAKCERFDRFMREITVGDPELLAFHMAFLGYCLTGSTREEIFAFWYGTGGNGKSKLAELMLRILGDYACKAMPDILFRSEKSEKHETEIAHLHGRRLVVCNESKQGRTLDDGKIKDLTGSDTITARRMREDPWSWSPTHKLVLFGQYKPALRSVDGGLKRRTKLVPFAAKFEGENVDKDLAQKLEAETPGILAKLLAACVEWMAMGIPACRAVDAATGDYFRDEDTIGSFFQGECLTAPDAKVASKALRERYVAWCQERSEEKPIGAKAFTQAVKNLGAVETRVRVDRTPVRGWVGIRLLSSEEQDQCDRDQTNMPFAGGGTAP